eukprot:10107007-Prorocentrum_lima.AAC.1
MRPCHTCCGAGALNAYRYLDSAGQALPSWLRVQHPQRSEHNPQNDFRGEAGEVDPSSSVDT